MSSTRWTCLSIAAVLALAACSTSQERYAYPGCGDAGTDTCPNDLVFFCAARTIEAKYDACQVDVECVLVTPADSCTALFDCGPTAVNGASLAAFDEEFRTEASAYCGASPDCVIRTGCAPPEGVPAAACVDGGCAVVHRDAGPALLGSQERYSYPGCEDAGSYGCPNLLVFYCAARSIEADHNQCSGDSDCVLASPDDGCSGYFSCAPTSVAKTTASQFEHAFTTEVFRYCGDAGACMSSGSCVDQGEPTAACRGNQCTVLFTDAGTADAGP